MPLDPTFRQLTRFEAVVWLWHPSLARGRVTFLEGPAGVGSTAVCIDLAARLSRGGSPSNGSAAAGGHFGHLDGH